MTISQKPCIATRTTMATKKTKKEWIEWFKSIDDDVEIELKLFYSTYSVNGKVKKITITC